MKCNEKRNDFHQYFHDRNASDFFIINDIISQQSKLILTFQNSIYGHVRIYLLFWGVDESLEN